MAQFPAPEQGIVLTHFIAAADSWIIINAGGPPTDDKPTVTLGPPPRPACCYRLIRCLEDRDPRVDLA